MRAALIALVTLTNLAACAHHGRQREAKTDKSEQPGPTSLSLPTGLVGDGQQHSYSEPQPR